MRQIDLGPGQPDEVVCQVTDEEGRCLTCADALDTARIIQVDKANGLAVAHGPQGIIEIDISLLEAIAPGDLVLVHGGVALAGVEKEL